jgi:site-specific recombinase XerD
MPLLERITGLVTPHSEQLLRSYIRSLKYQNRSQRTIDSYVETIKQLADTLPEWKHFEDVEQADIEDYITKYAIDHTPGGVAVRFRSLRAFFSWMVLEEIIENSPMRKLKQPYVPEVPVDVISKADITKLLKVCSGRDFESRRDTALVLVMYDCGVRVGELTGMNLDDVDLDLDAIHVVGKGRRPRAVSFANKTGVALDRYLRERSKHPMATKITKLWIGSRNQGLTESGVTQMLRRRCTEAGIPRIHPHQLRHTFSHEFRANGGSEDDLMRLGGWKSRTMLSRYGASAGDQRAREAHRQFSPADHL